MSLQGLRQYADDPEFQQKWDDVKGIAKAKAIAHIREITGVQISDNVMLDIQVRRMPPRVWATEQRSLHMLLLV